MARVYTMQVPPSRRVGRWGRRLKLLRVAAAFWERVQAFSGEGKGSQEENVT